MKVVLRRVIVGLLVVVGLGAAGLMCQRVGARGRYVTRFSTYGSGPEGTRALYLLAEQRGMHPIHWAEDLGNLPEHGILFALGGCDRPMPREMSSIDRRHLMEWVSEGGVLVVAGLDDYVSEDQLGASMSGSPEACEPSGLAGMLARADRREREHDDDAHREDGRREIDDLDDGIRDDPEDTYDQVTEDELAPASYATAIDEPLRGLPLIPMRRPLDINVKAGRQANTFLMIDDRPAGVVLHQGHGRVILLASASPFQNRELRDQYGAAVFTRLVRAYAPHGPVIFDEYHLGVGERRSIMRYLRQAGVGALVLQVLLLVAFWLWRSALRFGSVRVRPPPEPAGTVSYVAGVGTLYEKSRDPRGAAAIVAKRALAAIAAHHRISSSEPGAIAGVLEARKRPQSANDVRRLATIADSARDLARTITEIDGLRERVCADGAK